MKRIAYHVYVNSRPLVRRFFRERSRLAQIDNRFVGAYIAGRFDGDGTLRSHATDRLSIRVRSRGRFLLADVNWHHREFGAVLQEGE